MRTGIVSRVYKDPNTVDWGGGDVSYKGWSFAEESCK